jgi:Na+/H+-dicarboxylate symporter
LFLAALTPSIIGIVLSIISYFAFGWLSATAVVLGIAGIGASVKLKKDGNALWVLCLILNIVTLIIGIVFFFFYIIGIGMMLSGGTTAV